ncbi:MAG: translocation/assembly module TamB domain-containing protein [Candidatus Adiutrix sp.]|jgi:translocation and assembly module TamB|nr:translocation/assembly module TamB domain-containing protein [Candidatus Adiutrix sp.]
MLKALGAALAVALAAAAALIVWLGTPAGLEFLGRRLTDLLAGQGLTLSWSELSGPLPGRLYARDLVLADARGRLAVVRAAEIEWRPAALLRGVVHVPKIRLDGPELFRRPESDAAAEATGGPFSLPVGIRLDELEINAGKIYAEFLNPDRETGLDFFARGSARLEGREAALTLTAGARVVGLPDRPAGSPPADDPGGTVNLKADLSLPGAVGPLRGRLTLRGQALRWPSNLLNDLLGPELWLTASFSGQGRAYAAEIEQGEAGLLRLSGRADYQREDDWAESPLRVDLSASLTDLSVLIPGLAGSLTARFAGAGVAAENMTADLALESPALARGASRLEHVSARLTASGRISRPGALAGGEAPGALLVDLSGLATAAVGSSPGGPGRLSAEWSFTADGDGYQAEAKNLTGAVAGATFAGRGALAAGLNPVPPNGAISAEIKDWTYLAALSGLELSGAPARLEAGFGNDGAGSARAALQLPLLQLQSDGLDRLTLNEVEISLKADDIFEKSGLELTASLGAGRAGPARWASGGLRAAESSFSLTLDRLGLADRGGAASDGLRAAGTYDLAASAVSLKSLELSLAQSGLKLTEPFQINPTQNLIGPLKVALKPSGLVSARADLAPGARRLEAEIAALPYSIFQPFSDFALPEGQVESFKAVLTETEAGPTGYFSLAARVAPDLPASLAAGSRRRFSAALTLDGVVEAGARPLLRGAGRIQTDGGGGELSFRLPLAAGGAGLRPRPAPLGSIEAKADWSGPVAQLWRLAGQPDRFLSGRAAAQIEASGPLAAPRLSGALFLAGGRYVDNVLGLLIRDIALEAHVRPGRPFVAALEARGGRGGGLLAEVALSEDLSSLEAKGELSGFNPFTRDDLSLNLSGRLAAAGSPAAPEIKADLTVNRGELNLVTVLGGASVRKLDLGGEDMEKAGAGPSLNVAVSAPNQFFIRGFGLDSEWQGRLHIGGAAARPSLAGEVSPVRGYLEIFSKEFELSGGEISFAGGAEIDPDLNLELTNAGPEITAVIRADGRASRPTLTLSSRPPLPREEVLSQVLFGKSASRISRFEALQLADGLRELAMMGSGGWNPLSSLRQSLGLDVLRLGGGEGRERRLLNPAGGPSGELRPDGAKAEETESGLSVEAGRYLGDDIYVGLEHSPSGGTALRMEVELGPNLSLQGRSSAETSRVGLGWKRDY